MSALLHPVGPEPERTYWLRRAAVLAALLVVVLVVVSLVVNLSRDPGQVSAVPPSVTPAAGEPSQSVAGAAATAGTPPPSTRPEATPSATSEPKPKSSAKPRTTPAPSEAAAPVCDPAQLRATITGKQKLEPEDDTTFELSLINGSASTCRVQVTAANFELKIYSGTDRIWSSRDCDTAVKRISKDVASEQAVEWKMTWNGRRSATDCKSRAETPQAGTYFATSQLSGAKPAQLRMILRG